jgi:hypothetical protein
MSTGVHLRSAGSRGRGPGARATPPPPCAAPTRTRKAEAKPRARAPRSPAPPSKSHRAGAVVPDPALLQHYGQPLVGPMGLPVAFGAPPPPPLAQQSKRCACKKARCLKLYCVCFAAGAALGGGRGPERGARRGGGATTATGAWGALPPRRRAAAVVVRRGAPAPMRRPPPLPRPPRARAAAPRHVLRRLRLREVPEHRGGPGGRHARARKGAGPQPAVVPPKGRPRRRAGRAGAAQEGLPLQEE